MRDNKPILLVEDDEVDVMTVSRALTELRIGNRLDVCGDGEEALGHLADPAVRPCVILLDVNMPCMNGLELLARLKEDPRLRSIPVIMLTTSRNERDRMESFDRSVAGYMVKPVDYSQFVSLIRQIDMYWTLSEVAAP